MQVLKNNCIWKYENKSKLRLMIACVYTTQKWQLWKCLRLCRFTNILFLFNQWIIKSKYNFQWKHHWLQIDFEFLLIILLRKTNTCRNKRKRRKVVFPPLYKWVVRLGNIFWLDLIRQTAKSPWGTETNDDRLCNYIVNVLFVN